MSNAISPYKQFFRTAEYALIVFGLIVLIGPKVFSTNGINQEAKMALDKVSKLQDTQTHPQSLVKKRQGNKQTARNNQSGDGATGSKDTAGALNVGTKQSNSFADIQRPVSKSSDDIHHHPQDLSASHASSVWTHLLLRNNEH